MDLWCGRVVALTHAAHRCIALRAPSLGGAGLSSLNEVSRTASFPDISDEACWSIYLDDTTIIESVDKSVAQS